MFLSTLFQQIARSKRSLLVLPIAVAVVCGSTLFLMLLSSLGVFEPRAHPLTTLATPVSGPAAPLAGEGGPGFPSCIDRSGGMTAKVVEVVDGDTIRVLSDDGVTTVRYIGIDTPEVTKYQTKLGLQAQQRNLDLVLQRSVTMYPDLTTVDGYGRHLRHVFVGDVWVNQQMVLEGLAEEEPYEPDTHCRWELAKAELVAKQARFGIWQMEGNISRRNIENPAEAVASGNYLPASLLITAVNVSKEFVDLLNNSMAQIDLQGWYLVSERGDQICSLKGVLTPGQTLRVYSQKGKDGFSCNSPDPVWHNTNQDPAALYDPAGNMIDRK